MDYYIKSFLQKNVIVLLMAVFITIGVELTVCLFDEKREKYSKYVLIANLITNPILNIILLGVGGLITKNILYEYQNVLYYGIVLVLEILVVISEALILKFYTAKKFKTTFKLSLKVNVASFLVGLIISFIVSFQNIYYFIQ